jgi:hypothetical protein
MESPQEAKWLGYTKVYAAFGGAALLLAFACYMAYCIFYPDPMPEPIKSFLVKISPSFQDRVVFGFLAIIWLLLSTRHMAGEGIARIEKQIKYMHDEIERLNNAIRRQDR